MRPSLYDKLFTVNSTDHIIIWLIKSTIQRFNQHHLSQMGGQLAYYFLLSMFPFLLFLQAFIGSLNIHTDTIFRVLSPVLPAQIIEIITQYNQYISSNPSFNFVSFGIVVTLFSASSAVSALIHAINLAYDIEEKRNFFHNLLLSMVATFLIGVTALLSMVLITASSSLLDFLAATQHAPANMIWTLKIIAWAISGILLFFIISSIYYITPNKKMKYRKVLAGTLFFLVGWVALTIGFSIYVNYFSNHSMLYGSIGAIIILLLWLYSTGIILMLGAEINSLLEHGRAQP